MQKLPRSLTTLGMRREMRPQSDGRSLSFDAGAAGTEPQRERDPAVNRNPPFPAERGPLSLLQQPGCTPEWANCGPFEGGHATHSWTIPRRYRAASPEDPKGTNRPRSTGPEANS